MNPKPHKMYEIKLKGLLGKHWQAQFEGMDMSYVGKYTVLTGEISDQSSLHGFLNRLRDLNITLISVNCLNCEE